MLEKPIKLIKDLFRPTKLNQIIFFVTSKCNSHCQHCFYWRNFNEKEDLDLKEIKRISSSLPSFSDLLLSGGEPFLREDLADITKVFFENNKIKTVNIPTNGLLKEKILKDIFKISQIDPRLSVYINFSLDGPAKIHNFIRGVPENFEKTIATLKSLYEKSRDRNNIFLGITTVVNFYNFKYLDNLMNYINYLKLPKVLHYFEIVRGETKESEFSKKISFEDYQDLYNKILDYQEKRFTDFYKGERWAFLKTKLALTHLKLFYKIQKESYFNIKKWPMQCVAGRNIFVIDYNGNLRVCELKNKVATAKELNYCLSGWKEIFKKERKNIEKERCSCTHSCFLYQSIHYSPKVIFLYFIPSFLKSLFLK